MHFVIRNVDEVIIYLNKMRGEKNANQPTTTIQTLFLAFIQPDFTISHGLPRRILFCFAKLSVRLREYEAYAMLMAVDAVVAVSKNMMKPYRCRVSAISDPNIPAKESITNIIEIACVLNN